jgi:PAS domain S-box-containing protein
MDDTARVLHVDPDPGFRDALRESLDVFEVFTASGAGDALDILAGDPPIACVVSEYDLPDTDGTEFLRTVRARFPDRDVPFVVVTDAGSESVVAEALNAGATGYVAKDGPETVARATDRVRRAVQAGAGRTGTHFDTLARAMEDPVYVLDAEGQFTYVNEAFLDLVGYDRGELLGADPSIIKDEDAVATAERNLGRILSADGPDSVTFEVAIQPKNGDAITCEDHMGALPGERFRGSLGVLRDVTARKKRERRLQWYEGIVETTGDTAAVYDADGRFRVANERLASLYDTSPAQLRGERSRLVTALRERNEGDPFRELVEGDREEFRTELAYEPPSGDRRVTDVWLSRITDDGRFAGVALVGRDVTARRERRRELERKQQFLERIQEVTAVGGWEIDLQSDTLRWTDEVYRIHGLSTEFEPTVEEALDAYHPEDRSEMEAALDRLTSEGESFERELRIVTADGETRWVRARGTPWRDDDGTIVGARGTVQDITDRVEYERRLETQRDNLDVLNQMVRHDIRNDLQVVTAHAEFLRERADGDQRDHAEKILSRARNATELTQSARDLAEVMRHPERDLEPVALGRTLESELEDIRRSATNAAITVDGTIPSVTVRASDMLSSVFRNLLKNAIQHNDKDVPEVSVSVRTDEDEVEVSVADNGPGIPDDRKERIFGKGEKGLESAGTGIGLYLVRTLVEMYDGSVRVEDNEPEGTVFVVQLPREG